MYIRYASIQETKSGLQFVVLLTQRDDIPHGELYLFFRPANQNMHQTKI